MAKGLASQIPYGSIGPPGLFIAGAALIAPVLVTTPAQPTPHPAPAATVLEQGVTVVAPFASPAPSGPAAGGPTSPVAVAASATGSFEATAYGPPWDAINGTGVTSTGVDLRDAPHKYIVAADPSVLAMHTKITVRPNPFNDDNIVFSVEDTGGAIKGRHIDIYDWRGRSYQDGWGVRTVDVELASASAVSGSQEPAGTMYNPLMHANVTPERIDQGVDYAGTGYLVAIADGVVTESVANGSGWEGEGYIEYRITQSGFLYGAYVYYAEGVDTVVSVGEQVKGGSRLCNLRSPMPHGIEIGFAAGVGEESYYAYHDGPYQENNEVTRPGLAFSNLVHALGGPAGKQEGSVVGKFPEYMPDGEPPANLRSGAGGGLGSTGGFQGTSKSVAAAFSWPGDYYSAIVQIQRGADNGSHHSHAAAAYAAGITYVSMAG